MFETSLYVDFLSKLASIATPIILIISLSLGVRQLKHGRENQFRASAIMLWDKYLDRAILYPEFAFPEGFTTHFNYADGTFKGERSEYERYEWFVAALMRSSNEILSSYDKTPERINMVKRNIGYHRAYIRKKGVEFFKDIAPSVRLIIADVADLSTLKETPQEG